MTLAKQSRISLNYRGKFNDLFVLSHELGHAYHHKTVEDLPYFARQYPMSVAETASALAENIVINAIIDSANSDKERLGLMTEKLQRIMTEVPFYNFQYTFGYLFSIGIYSKIKEGIMSADEYQNYCVIQDE